MFDTILLILLSGFVFYGLFFGLIRTVGALAGVFIGAWLASRLYLPAFAYVGGAFGGFENAGKVITFIILFGVFNKLVSFGFVLFDKAFDFLSIVPFLKTINRVAGAILGFFVGGLVLGLILYVASRYSLITGLFGHWLAESEVAPFLIGFVKIIEPFLPEMLKALNSVV